MVQEEFLVKLPGLGPSGMSRLVKSIARFMQHRRFSGMLDCGGLNNGFPKMSKS